MTAAVRTRLRALSEVGPPAGAHPGQLLDYLVPKDVGDAHASLNTGYAQLVGIPVSPLYRPAFDRWRDAVSRDGLVHEFSVQGRLIVGLGAESVRETSVTLHRSWGMPVIPGSALKGLARHCATRHGLAADALEVLFGTQAAAGYVAWLDAWYVPGSAPGDKPLARDVITVHHPGYYRGDRAIDSSGDRRPPWDFDDPTPVGFLSARGQYLVALRGADEAWRRFALHLLARALEDWGVGAKTSSGYGRMTPHGQLPPLSEQGSTVAAMPSEDSPSPDVSTSGQVSSRIVGIGPALSSPASLRDRIASLPIDDRLLERIGDLANGEWRDLPAGEDKDAAARQIVSRLKEAGRWDERRVQGRPWVQSIIKHLNERRTTRGG
ncbi:MAG: type III-B CRISPR module RAMP protein Cmr6 [Chloroflexota bacterium]